MKRLLDRRPWLIALFLLTILAAGCATVEPPEPPAPAPPVPEPAMTLEVVPEDQWPLMSDDMDVWSLRQACDASLDYLAKASPDRRFNFGGRTISAAQLSVAVRMLRDLLTAHYDRASLTAALKANFVLLRSVGSDGQGGVLFTGYYEPVLEARHRPDSRFDQPIYGVPPGLLTIELQEFDDDLPDRRLTCMVQGNRVVPFHDREAIDFQGALIGKAPVLGYADEPVEVFFLHIQGSGQLVFEDGRRLRVGYATANGRAYRSIGRLLLDEGAMDKHRMSMQGIQRYLAENPEQMRRILSHNQSYVFFRPLDASGGPLGCYNAPLTAGRSIATDRKLFNGPAVAFIETTIPQPDGVDVWVSRFVLNQDTGGAIKGPGRVDLFFGTGDRAGQMAGRVKNKGRLYFLLPK